jgi:hypothetical protein
MKKAIGFELLINLLTKFRSICQIFDFFQIKKYVNYQMNQIYTFFIKHEQGLF